MAENKKGLIKELLEQGKATGKLTTKQINDVLEEVDFDVEEIDKLYSTLEGHCIEIVEDFVDPNIESTMNEQEININEIACKSLVDGRTELRLTIQVRNASQLYGSIELIRKLPHILEVVRDTAE